MSKLVMVVDNEDGMRALLGIMLERAGFAVLTAGSAHEALQMLRDVTPDLLILDVMLPDMDGTELCRHIRMRSETSRTPILILSARGDLESVERSLDAGANTYLSKPVLQQELVAKVRCLLDGHEEGRGAASDPADTG